MVDLHSHILYEMDDGARSVGESFYLLDVASRKGISKVVATPHFDLSVNADEFLKERDYKINQLQKMIEIAGLNVSLYGGAEVLVSDDVFYMNNLNKLTINNSRYLLIELEFRKEMSINRIVKYIDEIKNLGLVPILAHPERYYFFQKNYDFLNILAERGVLFQLNATSFLDDAPQAEHKLATQLITLRIASAIASDAHSFKGRSNKHLANREIYPGVLKNDELFDRFTEIIPSAIINDEEIPEFERGILIKKFF